MTISILARKFSHYIQCIITIKRIQPDLSFEQAPCRDFFRKHTALSPCSSSYGGLSHFLHGHKPGGATPPCPPCGVFYAPMLFRTFCVRQKSSCLVSQGFTSGNATYHLRTNSELIKRSIEINYEFSDS